MYTFFGRRALSFAVRRPGTRTGGIVVYQTGWARHFVGDAFDAVDELVANALIPMPVVAVGPRTAFGRFRFLCATNRERNNMNTCYIREQCITILFGDECQMNHLDSVYRRRHREKSRNR